MIYHILIEQDEAGYFVASVPALPGCVTQGKTQEEAIQNVREAIEGWFEVMEMKGCTDTSRLIEIAV
jgi:predicted RNase H-like HicB family nuclease